MAQRRMFAQSVVMSDAFLKRKPLTRCLYYTLGMVADDDGFVGNPSAVMAMCGARRTSMEELAHAGYVTVFDSGVVAINHWTMNNKIRKHQYQPTIYQTEKALLSANFPENFAQQDRIGEVRQEKERKEKSRVGEGRSAAIADDADRRRPIEREILVLYQQLCPLLQPCEGITQSRSQKLGQLLDSGKTLEDFRKVFQMAGENAFMHGENDKGWKAGFDWIIDWEHFVRLQEGAYNDFERPRTGATGKLGKSELEAIARVLREE